MKKIHITNKQNDKTQFGMTSSNWLDQFKVSAIAAVTTSLICSSVPSYASDAEIYVVPANATGATTLMMMLDISGSMANCDAPSGVSSTAKTSIATINHNGFTSTYTQYYCDNAVTEDRYYFMRTGKGSKKNPYAYYKCGRSATPNYTTRQRESDCTGAWGSEPTGYLTTGNDPTFYYQTATASATARYDYRITRVQDAMMAMLNGNANTTRLVDNLVIGLSTLGRKSSSSTDTGQILVPARALSTIVNAATGLTQRDLLIQKVAEMGAVSYTPTARSYAETAAYLLGTHTKHNSDTTSERFNGVNTTYPYGSGFLFSDSSTKSADENSYAAPSSITRQIGSTTAARNARECSGQGIYVLTDGLPNNQNYAQSLMRTALGQSATSSSTSNFSCNVDNTWDCIRKFAQILKNPTQNSAGLEFRTAVVGFGAESFPADAQAWGQEGGGGYHAGSNTQDVVDSVKNFLKDIVKDVPSMSTGASTIPLDALNPEMIQPYAYFPQFEPKINPTETQQLWLGNMKKYYVVDNEVSASASGGTAYTVVKKSKLQDLADAWSTGTTYPANTPIYKKYGVLNRLTLGTLTASGETKTGRKLLTNYVYDSTKTDPVSNDFNLIQVNYTYTTDAQTKTDPNAKYLMALLGYKLADNAVVEDIDFSAQTADLRQMGSSPHSLPVLLTQEGKSVAKMVSGKAVLDSENREDYILFGTTQGLLTVVKAGIGAGEEVFSFLPREMLDKQPETFRERGGTLNGGRYALYDGLDGEWAAHTVYVAKEDGTLTVKATTRNVVGSTTDKENLQGKQWVYGGMRMGGRSYYALDLTDIDNPKVKFHIDPNSGRVYSADKASGTHYVALENMGQSWSKPRLDYVNWKGQRKLVMFIGGGYDAGGTDGNGLFDAQGRRTGFAGYEYYNYKQAQTNCTANDLTCSTGKKGSGVYMFDADNGDLLWYADSNTTSATTGVEHLSNTDLKYSVVSEIKTVDRNGDGVVDHLYFGDLAGQAFRVDFKNDSVGFDSQMTKVLNLHKANGTSPRFYMSPTFTAHHSGAKLEGGNIVVAAFVSGNKSSPLLATVDSLETTGLRSSSNLEYDAVYAIYDYDIHPDRTGGYPVLADQLAARTLAVSATAAVSPTQLKLIESTAKTSETVTGAAIDKVSGWGGWYYPFKKTFAKVNANAAVIKGITPLVAMNGGLYVTMYDASNAGTSSGCGAGVKGHSFTKKLCLPTGVCKEDADYTWNLGSGIVNLNVGPTGGGKSIIVPDKGDICTGDNCSPCVGVDCKAGELFPKVNTSVYFTPKRWYERYAKAD